MLLYNILLIFIIVSLSILSALRPFGLTSDFEAYASSFNVPYTLSIEPGWWLLNKTFSFFTTFEVFVFSVVFFSMWGIYKSRNGYKYHLDLMLFIFIYYPIFFLGQMRSGLAAVIIFIAILRKIRNESYVILLFLAPLIHFGALPLITLYFILNAKVKKLFYILLFTLPVIILLVLNIDFDTTLKILSYEFDKWRIVTSLIDEAVDTETRNVFGQSPRFYLTCIGLCFIFFSRSDWYTNENLRPAVLILMAGSFLYILFSPVAILAQKTSYLSNIISIFLLTNRSSPRSLKIYSFILILYDFLSLTTSRFTE